MILPIVSQELRKEAEKMIQDLEVFPKWSMIVKLLAIQKLKVHLKT